MLTHLTKTISAATLIALAAFCAQAAEIEVKMLNKGSDGQTMVFEPALIKANVGDVIRFIPVDKGHDAAAIKDLIPEGASVFKGKINQQIEVTVEKDGAYVVKCTPHFGMGMVALIIAGDDAPENLEKIKTAKMPKKARERLDAEISAAGF